MEEEVWRRAEIGDRPSDDQLNEDWVRNTISTINQKIKDGERSKEEIAKALNGLNRERATTIQTLERYTFWVKVGNQENAIGFRVKFPEETAP